MCFAETDQVIARVLWTDIAFLLYLLLDTTIEGDIMQVAHPTAATPFAMPSRLAWILVGIHLVAATLLLLSGRSTPFLMDGESPLINFLTPIALGAVIAVVELTRLDPLVVAKAWGLTLLINLAAVVLILPVVILYTTAVATVTALILCGPAAILRRVMA